MFSKRVSKSSVFILIVHVLLLLCLLDIVNCAKRKLKFAVIVDWESKAAKTGFLFAVSHFNNSSNKKFMLGPSVDTIDTSNGYSLATSICKYMGNGVFMLFGERQIETSSIIEAYSRKYHIPYISPSFADNIPRKSPTFQIHMRPSHTTALVDLITQYEWQMFHYVYDSEEGLYRLQAILQAFDDEFKYQVRMRRLSDVSAAHEDLRALDKLNKQENRTETYIVLDLSKEKHYPKVMQQIREVGMNKQGYHYILGTLEFLNLEMERYQHGGVNITGFQLVNYSSNFVKEFLKIWKKIDPNIYAFGGYDHIPLEAALAVDAVEVIQKTLGQLISNYSSLYKITFRRGDVYNYNKTKGVPCVDPPVPWMHGEALMGGMKSLHFPGVTGNIQFDEYGFRKDYKLDVYNVGLNNAPSKIGEWTNKHRMVYKNENQTESDNKTKPGDIYKVTSIMSNYNGGSGGFVLWKGPLVPFYEPGINLTNAYRRYEEHLRDIEETIDIPDDNADSQASYSADDDYSDIDDDFDDGLESGDDINDEDLKDYFDSYMTTFDPYSVTLSDLNDSKINTGLHMDASVSNTLLNGVHSSGDEPFLMYKEKPGIEGKPVVGNDLYEGFCVDLAKHLSKRIGFQYDIVLVKDRKYGKRVDNISGEWDGMIGELIRGEAELAIAPLTINSERENVVDFSKPYMDIGISIMIKKPEIKKPGVFSFMKPFTWQLWMCIIFGYFSVGIGIFFVSRFSSAEWRRLPMDRKLAYNNFTLPNSLWFAMGSLMLQGSDDTCPRSASGRIIGGAWWFAVLITISSYTANLAAFLTIEKLLTPIESADDLVKQSEIAYGTLDSGSTQEFFRDSKVSTYKQMHIYMESAHPTVYVENIKQGIQRVRESKGKYAFLLESVYNEYANNRKPCDTMKVGHNLNSNHYGIATRKRSELTDRITLAVLSLTEDGTLEEMKKEWWVEKGECMFETGHRESKKKSLSLSNVAGIYFILIAGLVLSIIIGVCEFIYIKSKPERVPSAMVYMMPGVDSEGMDDDVPDDVNLNNHRSTNGPSSPVNGNAGKNNYFGYETQYNPPRITVDIDSNTAV